jgi:regulatory protein
MNDEQRISAIETQEKRGNRRSIFINGKFALGVDETVVADLGLRVGQQISEDELREVVHAELVTKARERALTLLDYRARSRTEIARRLKVAGFEEDVIEETLSRLEAVGLIDDAHFSKAWVNHRLTGSGMGRTRIRWELRQKGVPTEVAEEALSAIDEETEHQSALDKARRRWEKDPDLDDRTRRHRLASYLQRQGYDWGVITTILNEISTDAEPD